MTGSLQSATNAVGGLVCVGSSAAITLGLISNLIQGIRFLNITYPLKLKIILQTWDTDLLNINLPTQIHRKIISKDIPTVFTRYNVEPSFLRNFWGGIIILAFALICWAISTTLLYCFRWQKKIKANLVCHVLEKLSKAFLNFLIVSLYTSVGSIVFFFVLEMRSVSFMTTASIASFATSIFFMILGACILSSHLIFVIRYARLKLRLTVHAHQDLRKFVLKHKVLEVLCEGFSDKSIFKHGFLLLLVARDAITSLIITNLPSFPLFQAILLNLCSILMCGYLLSNNPFRNRLELVSQMFLEFSVLTVYVCVLALAIMDSEKSLTIGVREQLGQSIIVINTILNSGCTFIMCLKMIQSIWNTYKTYSANKALKIQILHRRSVLNTANSTQVMNTSDKGGLVADMSATDQSIIIDRKAEGLLVQPQKLEQIQHEKSQSLDHSRNNITTFSGINESQIPKSKFPTTDEVISSKLERSNKEVGLEFMSGKDSAIILGENIPRCVRDNKLTQEISKKESMSVANMKLRDIERIRKMDYLEAQRNLAPYPQIYSETFDKRIDLIKRGNLKENELKQSASSKPAPATATIYCKEDESEYMKRKEPVLHYKEKYEPPIRQAITFNSEYNPGFLHQQMEEMQRSKSKHKTKMKSPKS